MPARPGPVAPIALLVLVLGVAGCSPDPGADPSPSPTSSDPGFATPTSEPEPTASTPPTDGPDASGPDASAPVDVACDALVTADEIYAYNPNLALLPEADVAAGTRAATIESIGGLVCQWQNLTSGELLTVAVAALPADALAQRRAEVCTETSTTDVFGVDGCFANSAADAFARGYWVSSESPFYFEAADAQPLVTAALDSLP